jgi:hypothetical protein
MWHFDCKLSACGVYCKLYYLDVKTAVKIEIELIQLPQHHFCCTGQL